MNLKLAIFFVLALSACGDRSNNSSGRPPPNKPLVKKHIEQGTDLFFKCDDDFNKTMVFLAAVWNPDKSSWDITVEEFDRSGAKLSREENLVGQPDPIQSWQMNVTDASGEYAIVNQSGSDQATCRGRGRIMKCTFQ